MTDCVLQAYKSHLCYLGYTSNGIDEILYRKIKIATHGDEPQYTFGGIVPLMLCSMAKLGHGMDIEIQHCVWTKNHYLAFANNYNMSNTMKIGIMAGNFQEEVSPNSITLEPAIYLMDGMYHAIFSVSLPKGAPIMAIKLVDKLERKKYYDRRICSIAK